MKNHQNFEKMKIEEIIKSRKPKNQPPDFF